MTPLLIATLLTAEIHAGGAAGLGVGVPFRTANTGAVIALKGFVDVGGLANKLTVGAVLPVTFGFYNQSIGGFGSANYFVFDLLPGVRATYAVVDWVVAALELGAGPSIFNINANVLGTNASSTRTFFAMRAAVLGEVHPPSLKGLFFWVEPLGLYARLDNSFSEYRFTLGAGYRL